MNFLQNTNQLPDWLTKFARSLLTGWRKKALTAFFLLLTLFVIIQLLYNNWETLKNYDWQINLSWIPIIVVLFTVDLLAATYAWHLQVRDLTDFNNFRCSTKINWYSNLTRRIPSPIWYIASRALLYEQEGISKRTISLLSGLELIFFFMSGIATTLLTIPFWQLPAQISQNVNQTTLILILFPVSLLLVHPGILTRFWRLTTKQSPQRQLNWRNTITWLVIHVITWILGGLILYSVINLIYPLAATSTVMAQLVGIWSLAGAISLAGALTFSIIGLRELSLTLFLATIIPSPIALIVAILMRLIWLFGEFASAIISMRL